MRAANPEALRADLQALVNRIDPRITWTSIRRGDMRFQDEAREMTGAVCVVSAAGTVALVLSATGLCVLSYIVALRRREIGVRLAIGAPPSRIITMVIRQALKLVLAGMACGLALSVPMAFAMRATFVAKVTAADPMVFLPTIVVLLAVGVLAAAIPALRASRIDPIATLRQEMGSHSRGRVEGQQPANRGSADRKR